MLKVANFLNKIYPNVNVICKITFKIKVRSSLSRAKAILSPFHPILTDLPSDFPAIHRLDPKLTLYRPVGCDGCRKTGYHGRLGIYELLVTNEEIRQMMTQKGTSEAIKQVAIRNGMETMRMDGWKKVMAGITTIDEIVRVTKAD